MMLRLLGYRPGRRYALMESGPQPLVARFHDYLNQDEVFNQTFAIVSKMRGWLSSTLRILSSEAEGFGESVPEFDGNFHAVWALPGHG